MAEHQFKLLARWLHNGWILTDKLLEDFDQLFYDLLLREQRSSELMAIRRFETLLIVLSGYLVVFLDLESDDTVDQLCVGLVDENLIDWTTIECALEHLDLIELVIARLSSPVLV